MHTLAQALFWLATIAFLASWATGFWNIAHLHIAVRRDGRKRLRFGDALEEYPQARRFMRSMLAAVISWTAAFAIGLGAGILHA